MTQIDVRTFGATNSHDKRRVVFGKFVYQDLACLISDFAELSVKVRLKTLLLTAASLELQLTLLILLNQCITCFVPDIEELLLLLQKLTKRAHIADAN